MESIISPLAMKAFGFGILSAVSLPIGALLGIWFMPQKKIVASIMAFGAGSLLAALTLELVTPAFEHSGFYPLAAGCVIGGSLFVLLNSILNGKGAFLRKPATLVKHLVKTKKTRMKELVDHLSKVELIRALPPSEIHALLPHIRNRQYDAGTDIFQQGDRGDALYLIEQGDIAVIQDGEEIARLEGGDAFGEMALLSGEPRNATLRAVGEVTCWQIMKEDFDELVRISPRLHDALKDLDAERRTDNLDWETWGRRVRKHARSIPIAVTEKDIQEASHSHAGGAAMAIWLGILLDGIPESAVIGASMVHTSVSWALIAGLFLSNLPEAMSSAVGMKLQKTSTLKIFWMWTSLMLLTGFGALLGNLFFAGASHTAFAVFEGIAAGAMLVMIAETMLPEAYEQGGSVVGIATLVGFLSCLFIKSLG